MFLVTNTRKREKGKTKKELEAIKKDELDYETKESMTLNRQDFDGKNFVYPLMEILHIQGRIFV